MKRRSVTLRALAGLALAGLAGCGSNDVLQMAAASYAPLPALSTWTYVTASGGPGYTTKVQFAVQSGSTWNYGVTNYEGLPGLSKLSNSGGTVLNETPPASISRVLPYVTGNSWNVVTSTANTTITRTVDGYESLVVPAGTFARCFRIKTDIAVNGSDTAGTLIWAAPNVGDVQYATLDAAANVTITYQLSSYSLGN